MTTLATNTPRAYSMGEFSTRPVKDNSKIYEGSAVGMSSGYARALVAGDLFGGFCVEFVDNTVSGHADGLFNVQVRRSGIIELAVTSVAVTDIGKPVYASDDNAFTMTATGNSYIGRVHRYISSGVAEVKFDCDRGGFSKLTPLTTGYEALGSVITTKQTITTGLATAVGSFSQTQFGQALSNLERVVNSIIQQITN